MIIYIVILLYLIVILILLIFVIVCYDSFVEFIAYMCLCYDEYNNKL
jgi:hypothetical protein